MWRRWGGTCGNASSDTLLAVVEGQQPNRAGTGIGWVGQKQPRIFKKPGEARGNTDSWVKIDSIHDAARLGETDMPLCQRPATGSKRVGGSFRLSQMPVREGRVIQFVAAKE